MKKLYFGSNLKMYKGIKETDEYLQKLAELTKDISREEMELFIFPSFTSLPRAASSAYRSGIRLGAQNMCWEEQGQFTGEVSPCMLEEMGIDLVMAGHSERRHVFGETDIQENKKVKAALKHGFHALLCIGETAEEKKYSVAKEVLRTQLKVGLHKVEASFTDHLWVAYEPVWSIGADGVPASAGYAQQMHSVIKETLTDIFGPSGETIPVLYGGSVSQDNAKELISKPSVDGLFVGRAAWDAERFHSLIRMAMETVKELKK